MILPPFPKANFQLGREAVLKICNENIKHQYREKNWSTYEDSTGDIKLCVDKKREQIAQSIFNYK